MCITHDEVWKVNTTILGCVRNTHRETEVDKKVTTRKNHLLNVFDNNSVSFDYSRVFDGCGCVYRVDQDGDVLYFYKNDDFVGTMSIAHLFRMVIG